MTSIIVNNQTPSPTLEDQIRQRFGQTKSKLPTPKSRPMQETKIDLSKPTQPEIEMSSSPLKIKQIKEVQPSPSPFANKQIKEFVPNFKTMKKQLKKRMKSLQMIKNPTTEEMLEWLILNNLKKTYFS